VGTAGGRVFGPDYRIQWFRVVPFLALHAACLTVVLVGVSWTAVGVCAGLYVLRMFAITGFYHRYFSHKCFRTSRPFQFVMAVLGSTAVQRGPIWWAAHHRHHHAHTDEPEDLHSPRVRGFFMAHVGWFMTKAGYRVNRKYSKDWERYPELRFLNRFDFVVPALFALGVYLLGVLIERRAPQLGADRWQVFVFGFVVSTVLLYHGTFVINSLAHLWGSRRYETPDTSRNNAVLALITLGEGWHNNHHHCSAARQGFFWWEFDPTYLGLLLLRALRLIRDLKPVPERLRRPETRP
jgi:stearoyl-CoA desaturase (delta-9 desaturase)